MRYSDVWNDTTAGGSTYYIFRTNSIYDPYYGAGGSGCHGIDEMQAIYNWVKIPKSEITVELVNEGDPVSVYLYPSVLNTTPSLANSASAPMVRTALVNKTAGKSVVLRNSARLQDYAVWANDKDATTATNGNPTIGAYWKLFVKNTTGNALNLTMRVNILYTCIFSDRFHVDDDDS
jgi:hypothetical protein